MPESVSSGFRYFLSYYLCENNTRYENTYVFAGWVIVALDGLTDVPKENCIILSSSPVNAGKGFNIPGVPVRILKSIQKFSGFYPAIKIHAWEGKSGSAGYSPEIAYGFETILDQVITHVLIKFNLHSILIYSPTDPQLEFYSLTVNKILNKYHRILKTKSILPADIDKTISKTLTNPYIQRVFHELIQQNSTISEYTCKKFAVTKAFEIFYALSTQR